MNYKTDQALQHQKCSKITVLTSFGIELFSEHIMIMKAIQVLLLSLIVATLADMPGTV
jgi:hypothetical protein